MEKSMDRTEGAAHEIEYGTGQEKERRGRTHRVGTVTCGLMFVVYGVLFLLHTIIPKFSYGILFDLWPIILISLGVEILVSCTRKNKEEQKIVYDFPAVLLVMLLVLFVVIMAAADYGMRATREWQAMESTRNIEAEFPEIEEAPETERLPEAVEAPEMDGLPAIEEAVIDNWPESIRCDSEGMYAKLYEFPVTIEEPMDLSLSYITEDGNINMWIEDANGRKYFDEKDIQTGDYEVMLDKAGTYKVFFQAEYYYGSFVIEPTAH